MLGLTLSLPLYVYRLRGFWLVLAAGLFCAGFAGLDEYHQMFVAGRSPALRDVAIDTAGSITGIYMTRIIGFIGRKTIFAPLSMESAENGEKRDYIKSKKELAKLESDRANNITCQFDRGIVQR